MESEWISIKDRLPPQDCCVLVNVYDGRDKVKMSHVEIAYRLNLDWYESGRGEEINSKYGIITHWMTIPDVVKFEVKI